VSKYGQKAIAGEPGAVVKGYFFGAFAWFSIPLGLCATMSYVAIALSNTEYWPVAGGVTSYQINNALILPLAAEAVMGKGGAAAVILMVFMAVTSSFSAEIIAHASIVTFDIYQPCKFSIPKHQFCTSLMLSVKISILQLQMLVSNSFPTSHFRSSLFSPPLSPQRYSTRASPWAGFWNSSESCLVQP
jgi:Na+/proline symporter